MEIEYVIRMTNIIIWHVKKTTQSQLPICMFGSNSIDGNGGELARIECIWSCEIAFIEHILCWTIFKVISRKNLGISVIAVLLLSKKYKKNFRLHNINFGPQKVGLILFDDYSPVASSPTHVFDICNSISFLRSSSVYMSSIAHVLRFWLKPELKREHRTFNGSFYVY